jgi:hypothetical protein
VIQPPLRGRPTDRILYKDFDERDAQTTIYNSRNLMQRKIDRIDNKVRSLWHVVSKSERQHTFACIETLRHAEWARDLVQRTEQALLLEDWLKRNADSAYQEDWLLKWQELEALRSFFFEIRYGFELHSLGLSPTYEKQTVGKSKVDFTLELPGKTFLIELVSSLQTDEMTDATEHLDRGVKFASIDPARELIKLQGKILAKVAKEDKKSADSVPHKFPPPEENPYVYNVLVADTRGYCGGTRLNFHERLQLVLGPAECRRRGIDPSVILDYDGKPIAGLFDTTKPGPEAEIFRQRIHLLCLVNEEAFGEGLLIKQTIVYRNPLLDSSRVAFEEFSLAGSREPDET